MITNNNFFRDSERCMSKRQLGTKVNPEFFPTMEQKLVQRGETEIVADACNASYKFLTALIDQQCVQNRGNQNTIS